MALRHPEMQPLSWLLERNYPEIVQARLYGWRAEAQTEKGQAFWSEEFPKMLRKALATNRPSTALLLWQGMPQMPLPPNTLAQWIIALEENEEFGDKWSTAEQQQWVHKLRSSPQHMTSRAWEVLGKTAIHVLDRTTWRNSSKTAEPVPPLVESLWKKGAENLERAKQLVSMRMSVETINSRNTNRQTAQHIGWALEAQSKPSQRQALADHVINHLLEHARHYPNERDPTWYVIGQLASMECADTDAFCELFDEHLYRAHQTGRHDRIKQALSNVKMPLRTQVTERQAVQWVTATQAYWGTREQELRSSLAAWQFLVDNHQVPAPTQQAWMTALVEQVPDVEQQLEKLANTSSTSTITRLHHELKAHHLHTHLPEQSQPRASSKPRF